MGRYIDADECLDTMRDEMAGTGYQSIAMDIIKYAPTADVVEVKRGEWMLHPDGSGTCSCCNRIQKAVWDYDNAQNFCGHCGADMRGDKK